MIPLCLCASTGNCLLFTAMASLASVCSHFFWTQLWNLMCVHSRVRQTHFKLELFCVPDEYGSRPGDVGTSTTLQHQEAETLGRFEATVEALGSVWDRPAAWVLRTDLHDEGRTRGSHAKHRWQCTDSEYSHLENNRFGRGRHLCCVHTGPIRLGR